jgi:hypothetical protein
MSSCPSCGSERIRRGGNTIWLIYVLLIAIAIPATLIFHLNAALMAAIMIAIVAIAHLLLNQRVCLDCGHQWKG